MNILMIANILHVLIKDSVKSSKWLIDVVIPHTKRAPRMHDTSYISHACTEVYVYTYVYN